MMLRKTPATLKVALRTKLTLVIAGVLVSLALLELGLRLGGLLFLSFQEYRNLQSIKQRGTYRIMCVGESTTLNQYPPFLEEILNRRNIGIRFSVVDKGVVGIDTSVLLAELESNLNQCHPDMVVAMMGSNDAGVMYYKDIPKAQTAAFRYSSAYRLLRLLSMHVARKLKGGGRSADSKEAGSKPKSDGAYVEQGWIYQGQGEFSLAEDSYAKAIALNPENDGAYIGLGRLYQIQGKLLQAEGFYKKAIALNPENDFAYIGLGRLFQKQGKPFQAEDFFKKAVEISPEKYWVYSVLAWLYWTEGKPSQAEDVLKQAVALNPEKDRAYGTLSILYSEMGKPELAKEYAQKADSLRSGYYVPLTVNNFRRLKEMLDRRGIRLVCAQYPMRDIQPLKKIFENQEDAVVFVNNEKVFREAVRRDGYITYFRDMFGGDFGHCTEKGNRLLAENIANAILKEVFHR